MSVPTFETEDEVRTWVLSAPNRVEKYKSIRHNAKGYYPSTAMASMPWEEINLDNSGLWV